MRSFNLFLILQFIILTSFNFGQSSNSKPFSLDFTREAVILGTGAAVGITSLILVNNIEPLTPQEINLLNPADVNGFDRGAIGPYKEDHVGDVLLYTSFLIPTTFLLNEKMNKDFFDLALMYGEVLVVAGSVNELLKGTVQRTRPFVYDVNTNLSDKTTKDARTSFFSGHTTATAAISFFTAKVFSEYLTDNTAKILIWCGAAIYPAVTAFMRVDNHWHFPTDVMVGYAFGALVGYFIPELHKNKNDDNVSLNTSLAFGRPLLSIQIKF
jgi:membrane-associated phospholipid phosphatase